MGYGSTSDSKTSARDGGNEHDGSGPSSHPAGGPTPPISPPAGEEGPDDADHQKHGAIRQRLRGFYERNFGLVLVFLAQTFGSIMSTAAKLLTSSESSPKFHALEIIFVRMLATAILGSLYMWFKKVPDFPLGQRSVRGLLVLRGTAGFIGLFGLYCKYSLSYLEISDATAISFLVPTWTAIVCFVWLKEPYRLQEAMSGLLALVGVLFIARPAFLFGDKVVDPISGDPVYNNQTVTALIVNRPPGMVHPDSPSPAERAVAIVCAIIGTFAAATAYGTIRIIGKRAHSLVSVNYFAVLATIGSALIILIHPDLHFVLPRGALQWTLLVIIGVAGFLLQFLLTEGLQREKGGRATNVTYLQMVFALIIERVIWGTTPPVVSLLGSALIIGAAIWLSLQKSKPADAQKRTALVDEESSLLGPGRRQSDS
ncbi:Uu.00g138040.m01.CDS01 [Anthostomella pinea]|uniref:Uu.00g138040.m01.CDS01 n=1 Tax=Anthostomella pinea TaxID=933095 RepID=A0AAI8YL15_9PEZI|nr:Uu.00g138040.m01.CDS01 [Anthostomella pinea]